MVADAWPRPANWPLIPYIRARSRNVTHRREEIGGRYATHETAPPNCLTRGVDVRLVLESAAESGGALTVDAREAFATLEGQVSFYAWLLAQRGPPAGLRGTLHAKAVIADGERALVTSANLTGSALDLNMELGVLVEGGVIPRRLADHFAELITRGVLLRVS